MRCLGIPHMSVRYKSISKERFPCMTISLSLGLPGTTDKEALQAYLEMKRELDGEKRRIQQKRKEIKSNEERYETKERKGKEKIRQ